MLKVSNPVQANDGPVQSPRPPLSCRLHLWHHWVRVHDEANTSYVVCERCRRLVGRTIFDPPVP
jgi:hypothetical protein